MTDRRPVGPIRVRVKASRGHGVGTLRPAADGPYACTVCSLSQVGTGKSGVSRRRPHSDRDMLQERQAGAGDLCVAAVRLWPRTLCFQVRLAPPEEAVPAKGDLLGVPER